MFTKYKSIHFIGIGGEGMSGIAEVIHNLGYEVTGSDIKESETINKLRQSGIRVFIGHIEQNIGNANVIVISTAVSTNNPEVKAAIKKSIPVIPRAEMLAELCRLKYSILVAGAHGKTTTTSLIATIAGDGGLDPTVIIGGKLKNIKGNAKLGQGDFIIAEADESDGSFLKLTPTIAVITNIDREHLDFFKNIKRLKQAFISFIQKIPFYGAAIVCIENKYIKDIIPLIDRRLITLGLSKKADIYVKNIKHSGLKMNFDVFLKDRLLENFTIPIPGVHNVLNALSGIATAIEISVPLSVVKKTLANFSGIQRRFEFKGEFNGIKIFDDYGHHPTEIRAVLKTAKECFPKNKVYVIFQPHRYTRTKVHLYEFAKVFGLADKLFLMNIYPAGEEPIKGINSQELFRKTLELGYKNIIYIKDREILKQKILSELKKGDILITLGAGDVYKIGEEIANN